MTPEMKEHLKNLALSGALSGALLGAGGKAIAGARSLGEIGKAALTGSAISGGLTLGGGGLGMLMMGEPEEGDPTAFTKRSALGGALAGGALGAGLMSPAMRSAVASAAKALGMGGKLAELTKSRDASGVSNIVLEKLKGAKGMKGILAGGALGGVVGGYQGGDEGMQADFTRNLMETDRKKKLLQRIYDRQGE